MQTPTLLSIAIHEAGHAVAALADPPRPWIEGVSIIDQPEGWLGYFSCPALWQPYMAEVTAPAEAMEAWRILAWRDVIEYLAGPIAELRWKRYSRAAIWLGADEFAEHCFGERAPEPGSDLGCVRARLEWARPDDERDAFCEAWIETEELVARHWRAIVEIGRLLEKQGRLDGETLKMVWERT